MKFLDIILAGFSVLVAYFVLLLCHDRSMLFSQLRQGRSTFRFLIASSPVFCWFLVYLVALVVFLVVRFQVCPQFLEPRTETIFRIYHTQGNIRPAEDPIRSEVEVTYRGRLISRTINYHDGTTQFIAGDLQLAERLQLWSYLLAFLAATITGFVIYSVLVTTGPRITCQVP